MINSDAASVSSSGRQGLPAATPIVSCDYFSVAIAPSHRHTRIDLKGLWDQDVTQQFGAALQTTTIAMIREGVPFGHFLTLIDVRDVTIMPQDLTGLLQSYAEQHGPAAERVAIIAANTLQKLQYKRIAPQRMFGHFLDEDEATAWLFEDTAR